MMEAILSNMQFNQDTHNKDKRTSHNTATAKKPEVKLASEVYTACKGPKPARPHTQRSQPEEIKQMSTVFAKKIVKKLRMPALVCNESFVVPSSTVVSGIRKSSGSVTVAPIRMQAAKFSVTEVKKITGAALIPTTKGKKKIVLRRLPKMPWFIFFINIRVKDKKKLNTLINYIPFNSIQMLFRIRGHYSFETLRRLHA